MNVYERIVELLKEEPLLKDFKYVKSKYSFVMDKNGLKYILELRHHFTFNLFLDIHPSCLGYYYILERWFEKFSRISVRDLRDGFTIGVYSSARQFDMQEDYTFRYDESDFEEVYGKMIVVIRKMLENLTTTFRTVEDYYRLVVKPVLTGGKMPINGAEWVFNYLTAALLVDPANYEEVKRVIMEHVAMLTERDEPNIMWYDGKWDEIFAYLESLDFSSGKAREPKTESKRKRQPKEEV